MKCFVISIQFVRLFVVVRSSSREECSAGAECRLSSTNLKHDLITKGWNCSLFQSLGPVPTESSVLGSERNVCLRAMTQSGSTWTELTISKLLEQTCAQTEQCVYAKYEGNVSATWKFLHGRTSLALSWTNLPGCPCIAHHPIPYSSRCPQLAIWRDPRFRLVSHTRYRAQVTDKGHKLPEQVSDRTILTQLNSVDAAFERMFLHGGPHLSQLFVRYEILSDPAVGFYALMAIDRFLGLPIIREALSIPPLSLNDAKAILYKTSFSNMAKKCLKSQSTVNQIGYLGYDMKTAKQNNECPVERAVELYRAHAPQHDLGALLYSGQKGASLLDDKVLKNPIHRSLFGCFRPPTCATHARTLAPTDPRCKASAHS